MRGPAADHLPGRSSPSSCGTTFRIRQANSGADSRAAACGIGAAVAKLARAFEMRVIATKRRSIEDSNLDDWLAPERLPELLAGSDYVVAIDSLAGTA